MKQFKYISPLLISGLIIMLYIYMALHAPAAKAITRLYAKSKLQQPKLLRAFLLFWLKL